MAYFHHILTLHYRHPYGKYPLTLVADDVVGLVTDRVSSNVGFRVLEVER